MSNRSVKPITPGSRFRIAPDYRVLTKKKPERKLLAPSMRRAGRNHQGKITVHHRGGGHKRRFRIIDFKRRKYDVPGKVKAIEYDPMRTAYLALIHYRDGEKAYIIAPQSLKVGAEVVAGEKVPAEVGNAMPLKGMPMGTIVHNVELNPGAGAVMVRSAGAHAQLVAREDNKATLKLPSGEMRMVLQSCMATVGTVSNEGHGGIILGKAGRKRWLGKRPRVRGVAMNPVDHPMGGGEGKSSGGHPRSSSGLYARGKRTRKHKKYSDNQIIKRRR